MNEKQPYFTLHWEPQGTLRLINQRLLPGRVHYIDCRTASEVAQAITDMTVRGAPAIGAAAAYGLALTARHSPADNVEVLLADLVRDAERLRAARPTAVNLAWALERVMVAARQKGGDLAELRQAVLDEAHAIADEDVRTNRQIGQNALALVPDPAVFMHHCNTGALATVGYGTALGVIRAAYEAGREVFVYVDETRPRLQGARLTAWELGQLGIPHAVIVDGAAGHIMRTRQVDLVTVGCDRIAANGDVANKIGTYNLALVARAHGVPFYIVGPTSTIDLATPSGDEIPIEERDPDEVRRVGSEQVTPKDSPAVNPAFDVTPAELITAIITEKGIARAPYSQSLMELVGADAHR